jgi:hypothetical protein
MEDVKMSENQKKILQMLSDGKLNVDEAQRLLALVNSEGDRAQVAKNTSQKIKSNARYMHVIVDPKPDAPPRNNKHDFHGKVNVRVPLGLIRAGMKLATLIPSEAAEHVDKAFKEKGFSFNIKRLKEEDLEELITALQESEVNIDTEYEVIRVNAE